MLLLDLSRIPRDERSKFQKFQIESLLLAKTLIMVCNRQLFLIKMKVWNGGALLWWYRLWIRPNEFHKSLDFDSNLYVLMSPEKIVNYDKDLVTRRRIAHLRDMYGGANARIMIMDILDHIWPGKPYIIKPSDIGGGESGGKSSSGEAGLSENQANGCAGGDS